MTTLDFAFIADYAREKNGSLDALSIGIDEIRANHVPVSAQVCVALRLLFDRQDCNVMHRLEIMIQDPDGQRLADLNVNAEPQWPTPDPPDHRVKFQVVLHAPLAIEQPGPHSVEIVVDGELLKTITVNVLLIGTGSGQ